MVIQNNCKASFKRSSKGSWTSGAGVSKPISKQLHQKQDKTCTATLKYTRFRAGSWNVGTLKGRVRDIVEKAQRKVIFVVCKKLASQERELE